MEQDFQAGYDHGLCSRVFIVYFEHNSHFFLVFLLLILSMYLFASSPVFFSENELIPDNSRRLVNL